MTAVEEKISNLAKKKPDYNTKISEIKKWLTDNNHDKFITNPEVFDARLALANLVTETDFLTKLKSLKRKIISNKTKHLLNEIELKKMQTFDSMHLVQKVILKKMIHKIILVFQLMYKYKGCRCWLW